MVNDLRDNHHNKPELTLKQSKSSPLTHITDNPSDEFSNSDDLTNNTPNPTGFISPPPFYMKRPTRLNKTIRFKFFLKPKQSPPKTNDKTSTPHPLTVQNPTLPNYSIVNTNPNGYPIYNIFVNLDNKSPVKSYSNANCPFTPPSF